MKKRILSLFLAGFMICAMISGCSQQEAAEEQSAGQINEEKDEQSNEDTEEYAGYEPGATVVEDPESPTGYTAHFVLEKFSDDIEKVRFRGQFLYVDSNEEELGANYMKQPEEYQNGYYATSNFSGIYGKDMNYDEENNVYYTSCPISSGSFPYSYDVYYTDGSSEFIDDPANPSTATANPNSNAESSDADNSIVCGRYDSEKQSESLNLDFILPAEENVGTVTYVEYTGNLSDDQDLGIYLPAGYDPEREEPYKVIYASHGGGGNETDWFGMGHLNSILDNGGYDYIAVTMDNSSYGYDSDFRKSGWDFEKIEDNVLNYIIPYMESNYNVSKNVEDRAFCGLSMGSMTTFHMYYDHPEAFGYFAGFSGPDMNAVQDIGDSAGHKLFFTCGTCDSASANIDDNDMNIKYETYSQWLQEHPSDNIIDGGYVYGAHDWFTWSQSIKMFIDEVCFQ